MWPDEWNLPAVEEESSCKCFPAQHLTLNLDASSEEFECRQPNPIVDVRHQPRRISFLAESSRKRLPVL